jgi:hypothetical protein
MLINWYAMLDDTAPVFKGIEYPKFQNPCREVNQNFELKVYGALAHR